jgi:hypothetical protein
LSWLQPSRPPEPIISCDRLSREDRDGQSDHINANKIHLKIQLEVPFDIGGTILYILEQGKKEINTGK